MWSTSKSTNSLVYSSDWRIGNFTSRVNEAVTTRRSAVQAARCEATRLLRRLADPCRYSSTGSTACPDDHQCAPVSWMDHKLRVRSHSKSGLPVHRVQFNTRQFTVAPLLKMRLKSPVRSSTLDDQPKHQGPRSAQIVGHSGVHGFAGTTGRLCLRPVQWWAAAAWCQRTGNWTDRITVPPWVLAEVAWWASPAVLQGLSLATDETEGTLFTDASSSGWGAQLGSRSTQGQWSASQRSWHISVLEMQAVINAVRDFLPHLRCRVVRLMCDNAVTVAYIKNEGGTRSYTLMQMTIRLLKWCDRKVIKLVPVHLPGVHNIQADSLSRVGQTLNTEWTMAMEHLRPCLPSRVSRGLTCLRHSPREDSSSLYHRIRTPGRNRPMPCQCPGTTGGAYCMRSRHSRWSLKFCRRSLNHQEPG